MTCAPGLKIVVHIVLDARVVAIVLAGVSD